MTDLPRIPGIKVWALILSCLLIYGPINGFYPESITNDDIDTAFETALADYQNESYEKAAVKLESLLKICETGSVSRARVLLLLGICLEKSGDPDKARQNYESLKKMHDGGAVDKIPVIQGVDPGTLKGYKEVFDESFFKFKDPITASEMIKKNVVHAPRKSIEQKEKEKKKKKFPLLIVIGAVVLVGTAAVLLFTQVVKKDKKEEDDEEKFPEVTWKKVPAGEFFMGDGFSEGDADELPVHQVYLAEYYISKHEITNEQYGYFCRDTGKTFNPDHGDKYPVNNVSWHDAKAFCNWLSQKTGEKIDLPTEAQWEKAAKGPEQRRYPWSSEFIGCWFATYLGCGPSADQPGILLMVHQAPGFDGRSFYEAYHMGGNVSEWCRDWYGSSYYSHSPANNPKGPAAGSSRVIRGGSIASQAYELRAANREFKNPNYTGEEHGFRIVKE